jgi:hypothetical protein
VTAEMPSLRLASTLIFKMDLGKTEIKGKGSIGE